MSNWRSVFLHTQHGSVDCQWRVREFTNKVPRRSLDLRLSTSTTFDHSQVHFDHNDTLAINIRHGAATTESECLLSSSLEVTSYLMQEIRLLHHHSDVVLVKVLLPAISGYVRKSDFLEQRFECAGEHIRRVKGFLKPRQHVSPASLNVTTATDFEKLLTSAFGAFSFMHQDMAILDALELELDDRIGFPWLSSAPLSPKRVAIVLDPVDVKRTLRQWQCAWSLGIHLIVISRGEWFPDGHEFSYLREAFIAIDMSADQNLVSRIVKAVTLYPSKIDGIYTTTHYWLVPVAEAAEILKLPTSPSTAYRIACDKFRTRSLEPNNDCVLVSGTSDLQTKWADIKPMGYPLVVKPVNSDASECVFKVSDRESLWEAVEKASMHRNSSQALIEPYIDGPEFDANFILCDGEVLFCEVSDDFPSVADREVDLDFSAPHFGETRVVMPSKLPDQEKESIKVQLHASLRRQGFVHGLFHVEGRLQHSSMQYVQDSEGLYDLQPSDVTRSDILPTNCSVYLHEVNARPPGYNSCTSTLITYGVDYWAIQVLCAIADWDGIKALSHPFEGGAQGFAMVQNAVTPVGLNLVARLHPDVDLTKVKTRLHTVALDPIDEIRHRFANVAKGLKQHISLVVTGNAYGTTQTMSWWWLATFLMFDHSRERLLLIGDQLAREYEQIIQRENVQADLK